MIVLISQHAGPRYVRTSPSEKEIKRRMKKEREQNVHAADGERARKVDGLSAISLVNLWDHRCTIVTHRDLQLKRISACFSIPLKPSAELPNDHFLPGPKYRIPTIMPLSDRPLK